MNIPLHEMNNCKNENAAYTLSETVLAQDNTNKSQGWEMKLLQDVPMLKPHGQNVMLF